MSRKKKKTSFESWSKGCLAKRRFRSEEHAQGAILRAKKRGTKIYSYYCTICLGYHVTRNEKVPKTLSYEHRS